MGRDTSGVRGMNVGAEGRRCSRWTSRATTRTCSSSPRTATASARAIAEYRKTRGAKGVKTIKLTESKGGLAGALVVREHQELVFISQDGMVQRTGVRGISQQGRSATGVRVMNIRDDDQVSAVALVVESEPDDAVEDGAELRAARPRRATATAPTASADGASRGRAAARRGR